jgi:hypothetical protein
MKAHADAEDFRVLFQKADVPAPDLKGMLRLPEIGWGRDGCEMWLEHLANTGMRYVEPAVSDLLKHKLGMPSLRADLFWARDLKLDDKDILRIQEEILHELLSRYQEAFGGVDAGFEMASLLGANSLMPISGATVGDVRNMLEDQMALVLKQLAHILNTRRRYLKEKMHTFTTKKGHRSKPPSSPDGLDMCSPPTEPSARRGAIRRGPDSPMSPAEAVSEMPSILERVPHMDIEPPEPPQDCIQVVIYADQQQAREEESSMNVSVELPPGEDRADLSVTLSVSTIFEIVGAPFGAIVLQREVESSSKAVFAVRRKKRTKPTEKGYITAMFYYRGAPAGMVRREVRADGSDSKPVKPSAEAAGYVPVDVERLRLSSEVASQVDLDLEIRSVDGTWSAFTVKAASPHFADGPVVLAEAHGEPWKLSANTDRMVTGLISGITRGSNDSFTRRAELEGVGMDLFRILPANVRRAVWALAPAGLLRTLRITTDEPFMPWEVILPEEASKEEPLPRLKNDARKRSAAFEWRALGVLCQIGRHVCSQAPRSMAGSLSVQRSLVAAAQYDFLDDGVKELAHSPKERELLAKTFGAEILSPVNPRELDKKMGAYQPEVLHIICHGVSDPQSGQQFLQLEGKSRLSATALNACHQIKKCLEVKKSFVFLNACQVGQAVPTLSGGAGGFAPVLQSMNASAVIAPLWSVDDAIAYEVAEMLYKTLDQQRDSPRPLAEILQGIRARAYTDDGAKGADSFAAYALYGEPGFTLLPSSTPLT